MRSEKRGLIISFQYFVLAIGRVAGLAIATGFALTLAPCSVHAQEFFPSGVGTETDIFGAAGSNAGGCPPGQNYGSYVSTTGPVLQGGDGVLNAKDYRQIVTEQLSSEVSQASANAGTGNLTGSVGNAATMKVAGCGEVSSGGAIARMSDTYAVASDTLPVGTAVIAKVKWSVGGSFARQEFGINHGFIQLKIWLTFNPYLGAPALHQQTWASTGYQVIGESGTVDLGPTYEGLTGHALRVGDSFQIAVEQRVESSITVLDPDGFSAAANSHVVAYAETDGASLSAKGVRRWKSEFARWEATHCPEFLGLPPIPETRLSAAFLPVRAKGTLPRLTFDEVEERVDYIADFYFQQSLCSVRLVPYIARDPDTDGWFELPRTLQEYTSIPRDFGTRATFTRNFNIAEDAFAVASLRDRDFGFQQQSSAYDAVLTIAAPFSRPKQTDQTDLITDSSGAVIEGRFTASALGRGITQNPNVNALAPGVAGLVWGMLEGAECLVTSEALGTCVAIGGPTETLLFAVKDTILRQGFAITGDGDPTGIWTHELAHGLFTFWDYYGTQEPFVRGDVGSWGLMGKGADNDPPAPIIAYNKAIEGWIGYKDIAAGDYGSELLIPISDLKFGDQVLRYKPPRGFYDWYIFELRKSADDVPRAPGQLAPAVKHKTGVVIYGKRETHDAPGIPAHIPSCGVGTLHGLPMFYFSHLLLYFHLPPPLHTPPPIFDPEFGSCLFKIGDLTNVTLEPGGSTYMDDDAGVEFSLTSDLVLQIRNSPHSRTVVRMETSGNVDFGGMPMTIIGRGVDEHLPTDLQVLAANGNHVLRNPGTDTYDITIPGARTGDLHTPQQWISVPDDVPVSFVVDASQAFTRASALGIQRLTVDATVSMIHYDEAGVASEATELLHFQPTSENPVSSPVALQQFGNKDVVSPGTTVAVSPQPNAGGWNNSDTTVTLTAVDNTGGSGVKQITATATGAQPIASTATPGNVASFTMTNEGVTTLNFFATDLAGNLETAHALAVKIDKTAPTITPSQSPSANSAGWNNSDVTVSFNCSDTLSEIASCTAPVLVSTEGANQVIRGTARDQADNPASASKVMSLDKTAPNLTMPALAATYTYNAPLTLTFGAQDALSGLASQQASFNGNQTTSGSSFTLNHPGTNPFMLTATDVAGNSASQTATFAVLYRFGAFLPPVPNDGSGVFKLGSTVPLKFQLIDSNGALVPSAVAKLTLQMLAGRGPVGTPVDATPPGSADAENQFRYDGTQYVFNLSTKPLSTGTWQLQVHLDDGTVHTMVIGLK